MSKYIYKDLRIAYIMTYIDSTRTRSNRFLKEVIYKILYDHAIIPSQLAIDMGATVNLSNFKYLKEDRKYYNMELIVIPSNIFECMTDDDGNHITLHSVFDDFDKLQSLFMKCQDRINSQMTPEASRSRILSYFENYDRLIADFNKISEDLNKISAKDFNIPHLEEFGEIVESDYDLAGEIAKIFVKDILNTDVLNDQYPQTKISTEDYALRTTDAIKQMVVKRNRADQRFIVYTFNHRTNPNNFKFAVANEGHNSDIIPFKRCFHTAYEAHLWISLYWMSNDLNKVRDHLKKYKDVSLGQMGVFIGEVTKSIDDRIKEIDASIDEIDTLREHAFDKFRPKAKKVKKKKKGK